MDAGDTNPNTNPNPNPQSQNTGGSGAEGGADVGGKKMPMATDAKVREQWMGWLLSEIESKFAWAIINRTKNFTTVKLGRTVNSEKRRW